MKLLNLPEKHSVGMYAILFFLSLNLSGFTQISQQKKIRYLNSIEKKNNKYLKLQERKTRRLLADLSKKENQLYTELDSMHLDSSLVNDSFSKISDRFDKELNSDQEIISERISQPIGIKKTIYISENISGDVKNYLKQQLLTTSYFADSSCTTCLRLKSQSEKARESIGKTSEKLERLKSIQEDIKKHQETLKNFGVNTPEIGRKIKDINKSCYYYTQSLNGFKDLYALSTSGVEKSLLKKLSFSKDFKIFQSQFTSFSTSMPSVSHAATPNMSGYQTKAQVQAMLPQNAMGISPDVKSQLISNMQNALTKFSELKDEKPDLPMLKDKPDFKANPYKGLPLRKRLVPEFIFQPQIKKINEPFILDLGGTIGFKLTKILTPLAGASTKVGMGKDIHHPQYTYQGIVAKVGFDTKLAYGFSIQTWYETTWRPLPDEVLENTIANRSKPSLITGLCNSYSITKRVKGTLMIGYDFFNSKYTPYKSPWVIRMGLQ